jgi:uncharacterized coiled-coil protein SlyX
MMAEYTRLEELENRICHLEGTLQILSDVLIRQQKDLDRALERIQLLSERLTAAGDEPIEAEQPPPHY